MQKRIVVYFISSGQSAGSIQSENHCCHELAILASGVIYMLNLFPFIFNILFSIEIAYR